jgi:hypothetical protein
LNCTFINQKGLGYGGAVNIDTNSSGYFKDSKFLNNSASTAGAVRIKNSGDVTFENTLFLNNTAVPGSKQAAQEISSAQGH